MISTFKKRWYAESGYRQVLIIALPMILSTGSWSLQNFIDRMFLSWYSPEALAASVPAGLLCFAFICFFIGIATILNTFVAQYFGANKKEEIGAVVWQGVYLAGFSIVCFVPLYFLAEDIFKIFGHGEKIAELETIYFKWCLFGGPMIIMANAVACFYSGMGNTKVVMWVNVMMTVINIVLDYCLVFGYGWFPELGIAGAAIATAISATVSAFVFLLLFLSKKNDQYHVRNAWQFNKELFKRLLKFGLPNGFQMLLEIAAFTAFLVFVGRLGLVELTATNIALNVNTLAFMPMIGMMIATATLVGQRLGEDKPELAEKAVWSAFHIATLFFTILGLLFFLIPNIFIAPFGFQNDVEAFKPVADMATVMLKFIAVYCLLDAGVFVFSGALKGAGDTRFVAIATALLSWLVMVVPCAIVVQFVDEPIYWLWVLVTAYVAALSLAFYLRFRAGGWKHMRVIEIE